METSEVFAKVQTVLTKMLKDNELNRVEITMESSLIADLGFTSLMFVDLMVLLEEGLNIDKFPMLEWVDAQANFGEQGYRVKSLVEKCQELVSTSP